MWMLLAAVLLLPASGDRVRALRTPSPAMLPVITAVASAAFCVVLIPLPYGPLAALAAAPTTASVVRRLASRSPPGSAGSRDTALAFALAAAALRAGASVPVALELAAPAAASEGTVLIRVAGLLRLGASPEQAWKGVPGTETWSSISFSARRASTGGTKLASALDRAADDTLAQQRARAVARAHRVGVLAVGPLGACFLPAFVCLGIVPVVIAVAAGVGGQLR